MKKEMIPTYTIIAGLLVQGYGWWTQFHGTIHTAGVFIMFFGLGMNVWKLMAEKR